VSALNLADARRAALRLVLHQAVVTLILATAFLAFADGRAAISAFVGGGISVAASVAMALLSFAGPQADAKRVMRGFYRGEAAKLGVTVVLMVLALRSGAVDALPLLAAYVATLFTYWIALVRS
jgi:ATP synthase protein I